ncbi:MAG: cytochrome c biogenesis protein DipZ [Steroidobacteraceae bacterium]|jgi:cytochrome c biogenesis protein CcdA/thiol-disulfide isomerase/thioredoxin
MILVLLVFLGGVLTILSPCILPVLPFVFARTEQRFLTSGLPMLIGMAVTFAGIATLAAVGGAWAVRVNQYGRWVAMVLLAAFAATLLSRRLADWMSRPFVAAGNRLVPQGGAGDAQGGVLPSLLLGVATGLLWAPCAGPILGLVLTGAALSGPNVHTTALLFAYAAGAATSLAIAILAGGRVFSALKRSLGAGEWVRRALGVAVLLAVAAIALGWDSSVLTRLSLAGTNRLEQSLIDSIKPAAAALGGADSMAMGNSLPIEGEIPSLSGATAWMNSPALTPQALRGKVVLVDFWTYSCINCLRALPYVKAWYERYKDHGLVVIGVHAPEFAFEKDPDNVRRAVSELGVAYPVALDDNYAIWQGFNNHYWPAHYFIDASGQIRGHHFGEGQYEESERTIRQLLTQAGYSDLPPAGVVSMQAVGVQAPPDVAHDQSPETYIGYRRAENFGSPGGLVHDRLQTYAAPPSLALNQWALSGPWSVDSEKAALSTEPGKIVYRFYARDLHLVLGPGPNGKPIRFRVQLDGGPPGANHGADTDDNGNGVIKEQRLYQLIRQATAVDQHVFSIEFLDSDVQAYSFTFG